MAKRKFKVGDRVRAQRSHDNLESGQYYEVRKIDTTGEDLHWVFVKGAKSNFSNDGSFLESMFELAKQAPQFKVGDRVRIVDNKSMSGGQVSDFKIGDIATIHSQMGLGVVDAWVLNEGAWFLYGRQLEPAPLFAVGDKVRWLRSKIQFQHAIIASIDGDEPWPYKIAQDGDHTYATANELEHATPSSTTGFTIPTDDEALPPKIGIDLAGGPDFLARGILRSFDRTLEIDLGARRISINDNKPKPAIVALIEDGQPLPATNPKVHRNKGRALTEADRLAVKYPNQQFGVFELVAKRVASVEIREAA